MVGPNPAKILASQTACANLGMSPLGFVMCLKLSILVNLFAELWLYVISEECCRVGRRKLVQHDIKKLGEAGQFLGFFC